MMSLNRAQLIGNVTRDPESRTTASGQAVVNLGIATNRRYTDKSGQQVDQAEFHNVVAWGKLAEICSQYVTKGKRVYIEGRLQTRDWEGQDGTKRRTTEIVAENLIMLDGGSRGGGGSSASKSGSTVFDGVQTVPTMPAPMPEPLDEIHVEDIPF
ncbi:single-stranded DNA-binding protein [Candidatus Uhrbacteria bacterium]|nr:single-stranded DNA-binding protein [Candidatus Uhrbacteria bacterium]